MLTEEFRRHGHEVIDTVADYLHALGDGPVWRPTPEDARRALTEDVLPEHGRAFSELLEFMRTTVLPHPFGNGHPRFFAWGNPRPALEGVLADVVASAMNPSCAGGDHAAIHLERCTTRWLASLVGFPGDGVLVSGGASAGLTALAAARHRAAIVDGWDDLVDGCTHEAAARLVLYASRETHSCQPKAARLLGLGDRAVRAVPVDATGRMDVQALAETTARDRIAGLRPFCVVATAGTVNTGAVDELDAIADVCERERTWFHIDGSLGGFGMLDETRRHLFHGLERADSVSLDPHKWLSVPVDCAALLVKRLDDLRDAFSLVPPYLRSAPGEMWFSEYVPDQTRPFRALRLWATIAGAGVEGLRMQVTRSNDHAERLAEQIARTPSLELCARPSLHVVAFRVRDRDDDAHREIAWRIRTTSDVFLTGTRIGDREALRACFMNTATRDDDVDRIVPAVLAAAA
ncbi:MAG TPA: pyridoxal-dependent decarboxylase [Acidimicrobiales bacterium]|nr:pyridoxal-dependent decarboxylase [Acidimicrobiales bacterium]